MFIIHELEIENSSSRPYNLLHAEKKKKKAAI